jgi:hypothetical protein
MLTCTSILHVSEPVTLGTVDLVACSVARHEESGDILATMVITKLIDGCL